MSTGYGSYRPPILDGPKSSADDLRVQVFSSGPEQFRVDDVADASNQFLCKTYRLYSRAAFCRRPFEEVQPRWDAAA